MVRFVDLLHHCIENIVLSQACDSQSLAEVHAFLHRVIIELFAETFDVDINWVPHSRLSDTD